MNTPHSDRGVSMIQAALLLPLLLMLLIAVVDLGRLGVARIVLELAAREGVATAALLPVDGDVSTRGCATASGGCAVFVTALTRINETAMTRASLIAGEPGSGASIELIPAHHYAPETYTGFDWQQAGIPPVHLNLGFLRPGEVVTFADGEQLNHSERPHGPSAGTGWPAPGEEMRAWLLISPLEVTMRARVRFFTPLLPTLTISTRAAAFFADRSASVPAAPVSCGDGVCGAGEECAECPGDCGTCAIAGCGNGVVEGSEQCESALDCTGGGTTPTGLTWSCTPPGTPAECTCAQSPAPPPPTPAPVCGDNFRHPNEQCDGTDDQSCALFCPAGSHQMHCGSDCTCDCHFCGDGAVDGPEQCERADECVARFGPPPPGHTYLCTSCACQTIPIPGGGPIGGGGGGTTPGGSGTHETGVGEGCGIRTYAGGQGAFCGGECPAEYTCQWREVGQLCHCAPSGGSSSEDREYSESLSRS